MYPKENLYYIYLGLYVSLCSGCVVLFIIQLLKPVDLKWSPGKRRWAMPPGPPGVPVLGNLGQMMLARRGAASFNSWVRIIPVPRASGHTSLTYLSLSP